LRDGPVYIIASPIGQKHRTSLGSESQHVFRAIIFFISSRAFVLADDVLIVFVQRTARGYSSLFVTPHLQPIDIQTRLGILLEWSLTSQTLVVLGGFLVDLFRVNINVIRQVDFRPRHVQKTETVVGCQLSSLSRANHVVRHRRHLSRFFTGWHFGAKWANCCHWHSPPVEMAIWNARLSHLCWQSVAGHCLHSPRVSYSVDG